MDCRHAAETLSAVLDGEAVSPVSVAQARDHCTGCPECAALLATMDRLAAVPPTRAPEHLVTRIIEQVRAEASDRVDAEALAGYAAPTSGVLTPLEPAREKRRAHPGWWRPHFTPLVSAAAVVLAVSVVSTYALVRMTSSPTGPAASDSIGISSSDQRELDEGARYGDLSTPADGAAGTLAAPAQSAPPYLAWDDTVWVRADGMVPQESELSSAGVVTTDLGEPDGPRSRDVLVATSTPGVIYVRSSDGGLTRFTQVTRALGGRVYALTTDASMTTFGTWPTLPARFPTPTGTDGSPVFVPQGLDDRGREAYAPADAGTAKGFAVAPGTPSDDPAAGNPGWTWWQPVD